MSDREPRTLPLNGTVLRWAREYAGLTARAAAAALEMQLPGLLAIEDGTTEPTLGDIRRLARCYGLSESLLLLPEPPGPVELPTDYRTLGGVRAAPSPETIKAIREAQQFQGFMRELAEDNADILPELLLPHHVLTEDPEEVAIGERTAFDVPLETQLKWPMKEAFARWRLRVQARGILVLVKRMPKDDCRGFSLTGDLVPTIVTNAADVEQGKTFTLFHEYGHLMLNATGVCMRAQDESRRGRVERWCNEFAAAFLIPAEDLRSHLKERFNLVDNPREWQPSELRRLATRYKVSRPAMALRLQKLGFATPRYYETSWASLTRTEQPPERERNQPSKGIKHPPGFRQKQKLQEIGVPAAAAILEAWNSQITDATEVADVLGLSLSELFDLHDRVLVEQVRNAGR